MMLGGALDTTCAAFKHASALGGAVMRQMVWGLREVSREVATWRAYATEIPDATIREDALAALEHKRPNTDGAALLWIVPAQRCPRLLRLLVAYEIMGDFLDSVIERGAHVGIVNGRQLHLALVDAIDIERPVSDYYLYHPWQDDGGYLPRLVKACRYGCATLPSYGCVRPLLMRAARLAQVQGLNHEPDVALRQLVLEAWAIREGDADSGLGWYETAGAASAWLTVLALMAVAAEPTPTRAQAYEVFLAYFPWIALAATLLDSYDDLVEDRLNYTSSFLTHYGPFCVVLRRIDELVRRATREARALPQGERHAVIVASMIALYLSKDSVRSPDMKATSRMLLCSGGRLAMLLGPVLRAWRLAYSLRDT
jgi:tetraprenyl-beta-curcumene synthase